MDKEIQRAAELIARCDALLITAGAGMGVDSGLPDFRGAEGFWRAYPPLKELNLDFQSMARPEWFENDPRLAWGFYGHRLQSYRDVTPHDGFDLVRRMGETRKKGYFVYTSNVDGEFQKSGVPDDRIEECHGSLHFLQCSLNCKNKVWPNDWQPNVDMKTLQATNGLPRCPDCGWVARPNAMLFGDYSFCNKRVAEQNKNIRHWLASAGNVVAIEIGAGESIPTVRIFGENNSNALIRIGLDRRSGLHRPQDVWIRSGGLDAISKIYEQFLKYSKERDKTSRSNDDPKQSSTPELDRIRQLSGLAPKVELDRIRQLGGLSKTVD